MIAVGGLGQMVLRGIGCLDMGLATVGGVGIVIRHHLDRLTQAVGRDRVAAVTVAGIPPVLLPPPPPFVKCYALTPGDAALPGLQLPTIIIKVNNDATYCDICPQRLPPFVTASAFAADLPAKALPFNLSKARFLKSPSRRTGQPGAEKVGLYRNKPSEVDYNVGYTHRLLAMRRLPP